MDLHVAYNNVLSELLVRMSEARKVFRTRFRCNSCDKNLTSVEVDFFEIRETYLTKAKHFCSENCFFRGCC
jgi:hypothetical protein